MLVAVVVVVAWNDTTFFVGSLSRASSRVGLQDLPSHGLVLTAHGKSMILYSTLSNGWRNKEIQRSTLFTWTLVGSRHVIGINTEKHILKILYYLQIKFIPHSFQSFSLTFFCSFVGLYFVVGIVPPFLVSSNVWEENKFHLSAPHLFLLSLGYCTLKLALFHLVLS